MMTFCLISPVGAAIGIALSETATTEASLQTSFVSILQGLATGTLLYVAFFEVIEKERMKKTSGLLIVSCKLLSNEDVLTIIAFSGIFPDVGFFDHDSGSVD